jgi:hypothetical protein
MKPFIPTWLYVKKHNITGLMYMGKTISDDPIAYKGSGLVWKRHLAKHGNDVSTIWTHRYTNPELLKEEALFFSKVFNIVESPDWANLKEENGVDGNIPGSILSESHRKKISESMVERFKDNSVRTHISQIMSGRTLTDEWKNKIRESHKGKTRTFSDEWCQNLSKSLKGKKAWNDGLSSPHKTVTCNHCGKTGGNNIMPRYHFDNCKNKGVSK